MFPAVAEHQGIRLRETINPNSLEEWQKVDILTDASERLALPMVNTFTYRRTPEGLQAEAGENLRKVFTDGLNYAEHAAKINKDWEFEAERRRIELAQLDRIETFSQQHGDITITSFSLDGSDYDGIRAIASALGHELPEQKMASEDILARQFDVSGAQVYLSPIPDAVVEQGVNIGGYDPKRKKMLARIVLPVGVSDAPLVQRLRTAYDQVLQQKHGGEWYAGRRAISEQDALSFIKNQPDLSALHLKRVEEAIAAGANFHIIDSLQYDFLAALEDRLDGKEVSSLAASGETARNEGKSFAGDCPPADVKGQLEKLGFSSARNEKGKKIICNCPFCRKKVKVDPCDPGIVCPECGKDRNGKVVQKIGKGATKRVISLAKRLTGKA